MRSYPIAQARNQPNLVYEVERGSVVVLIRKGNPVAVAVVLGLNDYLRPTEGGKFGRANMQARDKFSFDGLPIDPDEMFVGDVDEGPGWKFSRRKKEGSKGCMIC